MCIRDRLMPTPALKGAARACEFERARGARQPAAQRHDLHFLIIERDLLLGDLRRCRHGCSPRLCSA
eukprot:3175502-Pyramimonas_sp.AAC.1